MTTAAASAYRQAEISDPQEEIDLVEVDDVYAYRELQHVEALGLAIGERPRAGCSRTASSTPAATCP